MSRFPVLIVIGPGDKELDRVEDLLDSLAFHEPQPSLVVLVDDESRLSRLTICRSREFPGRTDLT